MTLRGERWAALPHRPSANPLPCQINTRKGKGNVRLDAIVWLARLINYILGMEPRQSGLSAVNLGAEAPRGPSPDQVEEIVTNTQIPYVHPPFCSSMGFW